MHLNYIDRQDIYEVKNDKILLKIINNYFHDNKIEKLNSSKHEYFERLKFTKNIFINVDSNIRLINNHHTKILRKSTMKFIEEKFIKLLDKMRKNKIRGTGYIQFLFFLINIDNILHNNIIINNSKDFLEIHLRDKNATQFIFNDVLRIRPKFICLNSMNSTFKDIFPQFINKIL